MSEKSYSTVCGVRVDNSTWKTIRNSGELRQLEDMVRYVVEQRNGVAVIAKLNVYSEHDGLQQFQIVHAGPSSGARGPRGGYPFRVAKIGSGNVASWGNKSVTLSEEPVGDWVAIKNNNDLNNVPDCKNYLIRKGGRVWHGWLDYLSDRNGLSQFRIARGEVARGPSGGFPFEVLQLKAESNHWPSLEEISTAGSPAAGGWAAFNPDSVVVGEVYALRGPWGDHEAYGWACGTTGLGTGAFKHFGGACNNGHRELSAPFNKPYLVKRFSGRVPEEWRDGAPSHLVNPAAPEATVESLRRQIAELNARFEEVSRAAASK